MGSSSFLQQNELNLEESAEGPGVICCFPATIVSIQETSANSLLGTLCEECYLSLCVTAVMKFAAHFFGQLQLFLISRASEERKLNVDILQYFALKCCQSKWSVGIVFITNVCFAQGYLESW